MKIYNRPVTYHAKERTLERTDISLSDIKEKSKSAYKYGYKIRRFEGAFYNYLCSKQINGCGYVLRVYEDNVYIFDAILKRLLTIYPVPSEFLPVSNFFNVGSSPCIIIASFPDGHSEYVCSDSTVLTGDIALATEFRTKQKAENYLKNNTWLSALERQGVKFIVLDL